MPLTVPGGLPYISLPYTATLAWWVAADSGVTVGPGNAVTAWNDLSGSGDTHKNITSAGTLVLIPALSTFGGRPVMGTIKGSAPVTGTWTTPIVGDRTILIACQNIGGTSVDVISDTVSAGKITLSTGSNTSYSPGTSGASAVAVDSIGTPRVIVAQVNAGNNSTTIGLVQTTASSATGTLKNVSGMILSSIGLASSSACLIAEIIVYSSALSTANVQAVQAYLIAKYGLPA